MSYVVLTVDGCYCDACGALLCQEEIDFECCFCCGGEGLGDEDDDAFDDYFPDEPANTAEATKP